MGSAPVLKPNEVVTILNKLGFTEIRQCSSHKQFRDTKVVAQRFRFIKAGTSPQFCSGRSQKTSASLLMSCSNIDSPTGPSTRTLRDKAAQRP